MIIYFPQGIANHVPSSIYAAIKLYNDVHVAQVSFPRSKTEALALLGCFDELVSGNNMYYISDDV